jgi:S-DNA-T family DNA segregation ATPase FtsK/SpoIIIE
MGPTVTQFGVEPGFVERSRTRERKVRVNQISQRSDDLALALATPRLRIEAPVPGRPFVGIEVPNEEVQVVSVREVMTSDEFQRLDSPLAIGLGHDVAGQAVVADLARMPHLLIAGTTGSGKSVCIKSIITCLIYNSTPDELRLVMIDPKMVELIRFNGLPHLYGEVQVDLERVVKVLRWVALEMDERYKRFADASARHLDDYNRKMAKQDRPTLPRIVVLIDELADLMMLAPEAVEQLLCRIAQMGRATGIHLVVATQRPSTDVVTGLIKANFPARISFATASQVDSRVILDMQGAETLLGDGDMLYLASDSGYPVRVQGCYVSPDELDRVIGFWRKEIGPPDDRSPWKQMMPLEDPEEPEATRFNAEYVDEKMLHRAISVVKKRGSASTSLLQRRLNIGYPRAARLMEVMTEMNIIGPPVAGGQRRDVLIGGEDEDEDRGASGGLS